MASVRERNEEPDPEPERVPPEPPPEPFAYLSAPGRLREPWAVILSFAAMAVFGVWVLITAVRAGHSTGGQILAASIMIILLAVGGFGIFVGVSRLRWRRIYRRTMGKDPWLHNS